VGMMEDTEYAVGDQLLEPGDILAMFSDGIPETVNAEDEEYGEERFARLVAEHRHRSLRDLSSIILADLAGFRGEAEVGDDVTLVMVRRRLA
jgi:serine phosphatase RsbU (regulator of sigma subunit)